MGCKGGRGRGKGGWERDERRGGGKGGENETLRLREL